MKRKGRLGFDPFGKGDGPGLQNVAQTLATADGNPVDGSDVEMAAANRSALCLGLAELLEQVRERFGNMPGPSEPGGLVFELLAELVRYTGEGPDGVLGVDLRAWSRERLGLGAGARGPLFVDILSGLVLALGLQAVLSGMDGPDGSRDALCRRVGQLRVDLRSKKQGGVELALLGDEVFGRSLGKAFERDNCQDRLRCLLERGLSGALIVGGSLGGLILSASPSLNEPRHAACKE